MHIVATPSKADVSGDHTDLTPRAPRRAMRSVFWRIFLWFWLAMLMLAAAVAGTIYLTDPDQFYPRQLNIPLQRLDRLATTSVALYENSGPAALKSYLTKIPPAPPVEGRPAHLRKERGFLIDLPTGRELSGLPLPTDTSELVGRAKDSADLQFERLLTEVLFARPVSGAHSGHRYVFLLVRPRTSFLLPTTPHAWLQVLAAVITSAVVCYWLARYVVGPVRRLQAAARRLAGGDLGARVGSTPGLIRRHDEFSELAVDFDDMAARIQSLLNAQKRLIADISHELGSPLTRVNVALGLAFRKVGAECHPELERIEREAQRLNELIRQLLLLSELENQPPAGPMEALDLAEMAREIAADAEFEAGSRRCRVRVTNATDAGPPEEASVKGVRHLLRSALENIVRNAIRYTAEDSEVVIELGSHAAAEGKSARAVVRVRDHGPGVPPATLAHLFEPFYRVSEARDRQSGGTGLGLAITRQAVEAHGGTVCAVNHPDGGLLVEVDLPADTPLVGAPRRRWDSNPRTLTGLRFSRPAQ